VSLVLRPPGDKSLSHRCLMLATLAGGVSRLRGLLDAADVRSTASALGRLGAGIPDRWEGALRIAGPAAFGDAEEPLDCGNSGTTARILSGLVAGLGVGATLDGDASLRSRPMDRVVYPLQALGARIDYLEREERLPIRIHPRASGSLRDLTFRPRVASAQVKSCLLLAGLAAGVRIEVIEPGRSRDHTERLLAAMGAEIEFGPAEEGARVALAARKGDLDLRPLDLRVPGDPSSAAFLLAAALLAGRRLRLTGVGLNPTRTGYLEVLRRMGARLRVSVEEERAGEPVGTLEVEPSELDAFELGPALVPRTLDEIPVLCVLAARAAGRSRVRGAEELRVKESDRLALLGRNLGRIGVECREREDGIEIRGTEAPLGGEIETGGDHRMAMAFAVLGVEPTSRVAVDDPGCVGISYPGFWEDLDRISGSVPDPARESGDGLRSEEGGDGPRSETSGSP